MEYRGKGVNDLLFGAMYSNISLAIFETSFCPLLQACDRIIFYDGK